jgi:hypothetical protein
MAQSDFAYFQAFSPSHGRSIEAYRKPSCDEMSMLSQNLDWIDLKRGGEMKKRGRLQRKQPNQLTQTTLFD